MRLLLATTCLTPVILFAASPAAAQSSISTAITTPVKTSTANNGAPSDVSITSAGSVTVTSGTAVTIDSNNAVSNGGAISIINADNSTGIGTVAGVSGSINNTGSITVSETYTPTDTDNDGDLDGPFASGTGRAGIRTGGAFTGSITNASSAIIKVQGNNSYGILLGGPLNGNLSIDGTISVTGDNSAGVKTGDINGKARIAGTISATGANASAVLINGNISGALTLQGAITSTGYRYTTSPTDPSKLDADDLLQGGPAVSITGNVGGGVVLAIPPANATSSDTDGDGIPDNAEGSAALISYGSAAALQIGATGNSVTLGPVANTAGYGLIINGTASGNGVYAGKDASGVVIGGLGGAVAITNGMQITGGVSATANAANATALRIGAGATVPTIVTSGTITASGASTAGQLSQGIVIDAGANVTSIRNTGTITATASATTAGANAIIDKSGSLTLVENAGTITATGADTTSARNVAIDLSANTTGATVSQIVVASGAAPTINGNILFGSGNNTLNLGDGAVTGNVSFGSGNNLVAMSGDATMTGNTTFGTGNDTMTLAGTAVYTGAVNFGGGADTLTIGGTSTFAGTLTNAAGLAVTVNGGTFTNTGTTPVAIGSLAVTGGGTLGVTVNTTTNTATQYNVAGTASFDTGSKLAITLTGLVTTGSGHYTVLTAGTLTGLSNITASSVLLPYMYKSSISTAAPANQLAIDIGLKTTTELGLNRSGAAAYSAIYAALSKDSKVGNSFLAITDAATFQTAIRQMLPDHAGGTFAAVSAGSRAIGRMLTDGGAPYVDKGKWGYWIEEVAYGGSKGFLNTASYDINGWGTAGGADIKTPIGRFGLSLAYIHGNDDDNGTDNTVSSDQYEVGGYWRAEWGGLRPFARVSAAKVNFSSQRSFTGSDGTDGSVQISNSSKWNGNMVSATGGASYEGAVGHLTFRPIVSVDYYRLDEDAHAETGGGAAFDLNIAKRSSDELAANATMAVGLSFGSTENGWFHTEIEGGRRQILNGQLGATTANFAGGQTFTLIPDARTDGWVARFRAYGGSPGFRVGGEVGAEEQQSRAAISLRATLQIGL